MSALRTPRVVVSPQPNRCGRCGHDELITSVYPTGTERVWLTYCPACRDLRRQAAIPEWFVNGLPAPPRPVLPPH